VAIVLEDEEDPCTKNLPALWTSFFWPPEKGWEEKKDGP
jgi:hypothetical protein